MRIYFYWSCAIHALVFWLLMGPSLFSSATLPWGTYYGVDFMGSGGSGGEGGAAQTAVGQSDKSPKSTEQNQEKDKKAPKDKTPPGEKWKTGKDTGKKSSKDSSSAQGASKAKGTGAGDGAGVGIGFGGGSGLENFPYGWYINILRSRLWEKWGSPGGPDAVQICQVQFTIARNGQVSNVKKEKSSGSDSYDNLALRAVSYASPFPPLPRDYPKSELTVHVEFRVKQ